MTFAEDAVVVLTLVLLEAVLSFDNAAILAAMVRKLPLADRRKALLYGLVGAYALRITAIFLAVFLIQNPWLKIAGGGYLLFLAIKHFIGLARHGQHPQHHRIASPSFLVRWGVPPLVAMIIQIEIIDLAFAIDQVLVAVAFTSKVWLIVIASVLGILFLRLSAAVLARVMDWLPLLEHMAYVAVGYVGVKLILLHPFFVSGAMVLAGGAVVGGECAVPFIPVQHEVLEGQSPGCEIPTLISVSITLALFGGPIITKLLFGIPRSSPNAHVVASNPSTPLGQPSLEALKAAAQESQDADVIERDGSRRRLWPRRRS